MEEEDIIKFKEYYQILDSQEIQTITNDCKVIPQPLHIKLELKKYQLAAIYQMFLREQKNGFFVSKTEFWATNIGILGENVGCGKTFVTLGLISYKPYHKFYNPTNPSSFIRYQMLKNRDELKNMSENFTKNLIKYLPTYCPGFNINNDFYLKKPEDLYYGRSDNVELNELNANLIVVPHNLLRQWKNDITKHTDLKYFCISSIRELRKIKEKNIKFLENYNIILCNASKYNDLVELTKEYRWERVFYDEAHSINIPKSKFIYSKFYWFITATYKSIISRSNTGFLRSLFSSYARRLRQNREYNFNKFILKTCPDSVKREFVLEKPERVYHISDKPFWIRVIEGSIDDEFPNLKEMMYAELDDNIKKYLSSFNQITQDELVQKNILLIYLKWLKTREDHHEHRYNYYKNDLERMICDMRYSSTNSGRNQIERRRQMTERFRQKYLTYMTLSRGILERMNKYNLCWNCLEQTECYFELNCDRNCCEKGSIRICVPCHETIINWKINYYWGFQCLFCSSDFNQDNSGYSISKNVKMTSFDNIERKYKTKFEQLNKLINVDNKDKRFLVFSNFTSLFNKYLKYFKDNNIKYGILKGNNNVINKRIRDFKSGEIKILLLNGKFYGSGLNLQDASDIIITHKITQDVETQVVGRANRMGRKGKLKIHYLIFEDELQNNDINNE